MLVEPLTGSGKGMSLSAQTRLPVDQKEAQEGDGVKKTPQTPDMSELTELAKDVEKNLNIIHNVALCFTVHKDSGRIMVTVTDESSGKVIREIPPSEFIEFADKFEKMVGMIFDQKV